MSLGLNVRNADCTYVIERTPRALVFQIEVPETKVPFRYTKHDKYK